MMNNETPLDALDAEQAERGHVIPAGIRRKRWPDDYGGGGGGLHCRKCGCKRCPVVYVRDITSGGRRRKRKCAHCGFEFTTTER